jgi:hypothetical protein
MRSEYITSLFGAITDGRIDLVNKLLQEWDSAKVGYYPDECSYVSTMECAIGLACDHNHSKVLDALIDHSIKVRFGDIVYLICVNDPDPELASVWRRGVDRLRVAGMCD